MPTIKRSAQGVRRVVAANARADTARLARHKTGGLIDWLISLLPVDEDQLQRFFVIIVLGVALSLGWIVASLSGATKLIEAQFLESAENAGLQVRHIRISGVSRMNEQDVYNRVVAEKDTPMPSIDVASIRTQLLDLKWVKDARVSKQLPGTLAIDIVERKPYAILEQSGTFTLVDMEGSELQEMESSSLGNHLLVSGPGARRQLQELEVLLDKAPAIRPHIRSAEWVGNRRWNLSFSTNQTLALPQGREESFIALTSFARLDGQNRLIGGEVITFDMRAPPRLYMRIPGRGEEMLNGGSNIETSL